MENGKKKFKNPVLHLDVCYVLIQQQTPCVARCKNKKIKINNAILLGFFKTFLNLYRIVLLINILQNTK